MKEFSHGFETSSPITYSLCKSYSKSNRREPTIAEIRLWECLRGKQLGVKFRRQHVIDDYIVDFVCLNEMLIVEVDGEYHNSVEQQEADNIRTGRLTDLGYRIIRFTNDEVIYNIEDVLNRIRRCIVFTELE